MRIGINALGPLAHDTGGKTYLAGLLQGLSLLKTSHEFILFLNSDSHRVFPNLPDSFRFFEIKAGASRYGRILIEQISLPFWIKRTGLDVFYSPTNALCLRTSLPQILGLQNVLPFFENVDEGWLRGRYRRWILPKSARKACRIIVPSDYAKTLTEEHLHYSKNHIASIPHGIDHARFHPGENGGPSRFKPFQPYLLWVSPLWNYKNWPIALEAFSEVKKTFPGLRFVMIGKASDSETKKRFDAQVRRLNIESDLILMETLGVEDLADVYRHAEALIYPSSVESFGFPVLEAMSSGVPVIASGCPALREVSGGAAVHVDPLNAHTLAEAIRRIWKDRDFRSDLVHRALQRAQTFSWKTTAQNTLEVIEACTNRDSVAL